MPEDCPFHAGFTTHNCVWCAKYAADLPHHRKRYAQNKAKLKRGAKQVKPGRKPL